MLRRTERLSPREAEGGSRPRGFSPESRPPPSSFQKAPTRLLHSALAHALNPLLERATPFRAFPLVTVCDDSSLLEAAPPVPLRGLVGQVARAAVAGSSRAGS